MYLVICLTFVIIIYSLVSCPYFHFSVYLPQSAEMKEKLVEYITNPNGDGTTVDRHVSAQDRGKLYRNQGDVFSIEDDDDGMILNDECIYFFLALACLFVFRNFLLQLEHF